MKHPSINEFNVVVEPDAGMEVSLSQSIIDNEFDEWNNFEIFTEENIENNSASINYISKSVYDQLSPVFRALCFSFDIQSQDAEIQFVKEYLYKEMTNIKKIFIGLNKTVQPKLKWFPQILHIVKENIVPF